jgi:hypothetical protein
MWMAFLGHPLAVLVTGVEAGEPGVDGALRRNSPVVGRSDLSQKIRGDYAGRLPAYNYQKAAKAVLEQPELASFL